MKQQRIKGALRQAALATALLVSLASASEATAMDECSKLGLFPQSQACQELVAAQQTANPLTLWYHMLDGSWKPTTLVFKGANAAKRCEIIRVERLEAALALGRYATLLEYENGPVVGYANELRCALAQ